MKKLKKFLSASKLNVVAFVLVVALVLVATVGVARAAITYATGTYTPEVSMMDIGVSIQENGTRISWRDYAPNGRGQDWNENTGKLLENMLGKGEKFTCGKPYAEELNILNSGTIDTYVRVSIFRYWIDPTIPVVKEDDSQKVLGTDPTLIDLHLTNLDSAWLLDRDSSTLERTVLYYNRLLNSEEETPLFADMLTVSADVLKDPRYDGLQFVVEVVVDSVQGHNAEDAILSAWGQHVHVDDASGTLSLG